MLDPSALEPSRPSTGSRGRDPRATPGLLMMIILEKLGEEDYCRNSKNCECIHIVRDAHVRTPVAKYLLNFHKKLNIERENIVMTWY